MGLALSRKIDLWKKSLLDFGKRNRLINFKDGKRNNVAITEPGFEQLFALIGTQERNLKFPFAKKITIDEDGEESYDAIIDGDLKTTKPLGDLQKALKNLRYKANSSMEEQGVNTLFLSFGLLIWSEKDNSREKLLSPLLLVPVRLTIRSLIDPYILSPHEDEIVVNPILAQKMANDFGIVIPEFDPSCDDITEYFFKLEELFEKNSWEIEYKVNLSLFSFLKINMYKDLQRNEEKLNTNPIVTAIAGETQPDSISEELNHIDIDHIIKPINTFQVVDADSSQQDAILLSKSGVSFVLQGPPGTGKSQTITNIISEALADGKKILFVSEKMAALKVVYNRLANTNLSEFCFNLHSRKANKKEILRELAASINIDRKKVRDEALEQLDILERKKEVLNNYQEQLHTPCSRLNRTVFDINGELASLQHAPDVVFDISGVKDVTSHDLLDRCQILSQLSEVIGKRSEDFSKNPWRNSTIHYLTNEIRHDIDSHFSILLPILLREKETVRSFIDTNSLLLDYSLDGIKNLLAVLNVAVKSFGVLPKWIFQDIIEKDIELANQCQTLVKKINFRRDTLSANYLDTFFLEEGGTIYNRLLANVNIINNNLSDKYRIGGNITIDNFAVLLDDLSHNLLSVKQLDNSLSELQNAFGFNTPNNLLNAESIFAIVDAVINPLFPTEAWFYTFQYNDIKKSYTSIKNSHLMALHQRDELFTIIDKEILTTDYYSILQRYRSDYSSFIRVLKSSYRSDKKTIKRFIINSKSDSYERVIEILSKVKEYDDTMQDILSSSKKYESYFGKYYNGVDTDWNQIDSAFQRFDHLLSIMPLSLIPDKMKNLLLSNNIPIALLQKFKLSYSNTASCSIFERIIQLSDNLYSNTTLFSELENYLELIISNGFKLLKEYEGLLLFRKGKVNLNQIIKECGELCEYQQESKQFSSQNELCKDVFQNYYDGINTDWPFVLSSLQNALSLRSCIDSYLLPDNFVNNICTDNSFSKECENCLTFVSSLNRNIGAQMNWVSSLFNESENFYQCDLDVLFERLTNCKEKKSLLEEWADYCSIKQKCEDYSLDSFVLAVEEQNIDSKLIVDAYKKQFYHLWMDEILPQFPEVQSFRRRNQEHTIDDFNKLDKAQFQIAQARVRERIIKGIPDFNSTTSTRDEIGILKRELGKQRNIMPLRKLFNTIPNLLTSLKPCFMMSPLSVSIFLETKSYQFDLVVFDEASQVHTEDAIGAIMRGKQVIIVGDTKQLPPTSFFNTSINSDDLYDTEEEDESEKEDFGAYESILDEAVAIFPEKTLKWHYRSRFEDLITFSNYKIYNDSLITFPSPEQNSPDCGVEYVYVPNGVYDRGKKRNNTNEAKKVADLVFEHFRKYPQRSLGVVTFSESQQQAVDTALRMKRHENGMYEQFFMEDREEPFFIKNLETVQGDERDTIILCIGYARDSRGMMYMNFGPLNNDGGFRRLNVAITRAKFNVKLVGSIMPSDISLDKVLSEGVRLLRSYIEFAQQGVKALEKEFSYSNLVICESPFEEAVYDFLVSKGYRVTTQVGCSGFRIDLAIQHPTQSGKFVLGIECDGAMYHSSRTARERDRLRESILRDMGWVIYRIWSTDWIKDIKTEQDRLIEAVTDALNPNNASKTDTAVDNDNTQPLSMVDITEEIPKEERTINDDIFIPYRMADTDNLESKSRWEVIRYVIEIEQPIHIEELCRRVAYLFGNQKATSKVREGVNHDLRYYLAEQIERRNNFICLKDFFLEHVRVPMQENDYIRPIGVISSDELQLALIAITNHSFGISPEDLFINTSRQFGYSRMGTNVHEAIRDAYQELLLNNIIEEVDGKVHLHTINTSK